MTTNTTELEATADKIVELAQQLLGDQYPTPAFQQRLLRLKLAVLRALRSQYSDPPLGEKRGLYNERGPLGS